MPFDVQWVPHDDRLDRLVARAASSLWISSPFVTAAGIRIVMRSGVRPRLLTDFVARSPLFGELGGALALHVAAMDPAGVEELLAQPFVRDGSRTVGQLVAEVAARTGEAVAVREFFRCRV
jgi:hypothetical protein